jgi:hypothetical protein
MKHRITQEMLRHTLHSTTASVTSTSPTKTCLRAQDWIEKGA